MKKLLLIALALITTTVLTTSSFAADAADVSAAKAKSFQDRKDMVLKHIGDRIAKMQDIQTCVQASTDLKSMRACKPHRDKDHHG
jgi:hypothetical protein